MDNKKRVSKAIKKEFLKQTSKEIRKPMNGVIGVASLLMESNLNDEQRSLVEIILNSGQDLIRIFNDLIDFTKIDTDISRIRSSSFNLYTCIENGLRESKMEAIEKGLIFNVNIDKDIPTRAIGDPRRIKQIINNIISNAVLYSDTGEVSASFYIENIKNRYKLNIIIKDEGFGLSEVDTLNINKNSYEGFSGIGLAISQKLLSDMSGKLNCESELDSGSTFTVSLMLDPVDNNSQTWQETFANLEDRTIMIIEKSESYKFYLETILSTWGCKSVMFESDDDAYRYLKENGSYNISAAIIGLSVDESSELTFASRIRKLEMNNIHIINLTSKPQSGDIDLMDEVGIDGYLPKPAKIEDIKDALSILIGRGDWKKEDSVITKYTIEGLRNI